MRKKKLFLICLAICIVLILFMVKIAFSADIDVGSPAIDRDLTTGDGYTNILKANPVNATGTINHIEVYMADTAQHDITIASFEEVSANTFTARDNSGVITTVPGLNTFNAPGDFTAFDISTGDYIGFYCVGGCYVDKTNSGDGAWYDFGDKTSCENEGFTWVADRTISLYATGSTGEAPPSVGVQRQILIQE